MSENRKKHDALACLTDWLNNGAQLLDEEIVESLSDEDYDERKTAKEAAPFAASENQVSGKKKRRLYRWKKHVNAPAHAPLRGGIARLLLSCVSA